MKRRKLPTAAFRAKVAVVALGGAGDGELTGIAPRSVPDPGPAVADDHATGHGGGGAG